MRSRAAAIVARRKQTIIAASANDPRAFDEAAIFGGIVALDWANHRTGFVPDTNDRWSALNCWTLIGHAVAF